MTPRTLVAGIGNVFLGDDGFGVEVVRRLAQRPAKEDLHIVDVGIRGIDLLYALLEGYARIILVDATARGGAPGTLYVLDPHLTEVPPGNLDVHGVLPSQALAMAHVMGARWEVVRVVGCEPAHIPEGDDLYVGLSPSVAAAVQAAVSLVEQLLEAS